MASTTRNLVTPIETGAPTLVSPWHCVDNQVFTIDGRYLMCANHGADFEPPAGECICGPCVDAELQSVPVEVGDEKIFVQYSSGSN
jgi:nitrite reductase/ring-hydroxylating ferredoxin subunit